MNLRILSFALTLAGTLSFATQARAQAVFDTYLYQDGSNVVAEGNGTVDLSGLTQASSGGADISIDPSVDYLLIGSGSGTASTQWWTGLTGPFNFGTGGETFSSTSSGDTFSVWSYAGAGPFYMLLDPGYVSGALLSNSATWDNTTLASLGVTPGTYTWSYTGGTVNLYAGTAVPEPSQYGLLIFLGVAGFIGWRRFKARVAVAV